MILQNYLGLSSTTAIDVEEGPKELWGYTNKNYSFRLDLLKNSSIIQFHNTPKEQYNSINYSNTSSSQSNNNMPMFFFPILNNSAHHKDNESLN